VHDDDVAPHGDVAARQRPALVSVSSQSAAGVKAVGDRPGYRRDRSVAACARSDSAWQVVVAA